MIKIRPSQERGIANFGWLKSQHSFSFGDYYDGKHMGFGLLRVINEDRIEGGSGFGSHPHRDMEIISSIISGGLKHQDLMGNQTVIKPGEIQRMSAGTGIVHSEFNFLKDQETHFLQIWILPKSKGLNPSYAQVNFADHLKESHLTLLASQNGSEGVISVNQDVNIYLGKSQTRQKFELLNLSQRDIWIQVISGSITIEETLLGAGDGAGLREIDSLKIHSQEAGSEFLIFDMTAKQT